MLREGLADLCISETVVVKKHAYYTNFTCCPSLKVSLKCHTVGFVYWNEEVVWAAWELRLVIYDWLGKWKKKGLKPIVNSQWLLMDFIHSHLIYACLICFIFYLSVSCPFISVFCCLLWNMHKACLLWLDGAMLLRSCPTTLLTAWHAVKGFRLFLINTTLLCLTLTRTLILGLHVLNCEIVAGSHLYE